MDCRVLLALPVRLVLQGQRVLPVQPVLPDPRARQDWQVPSVRPEHPVRLALSVYKAVWEQQAPPVRQAQQARQVLRV
jgi:hypothetical protein